MAEVPVLRVLREDRGAEEAMSACADIVGKVFGRLTVVKFSHRRKGVRMFLCRCVCGGTTYVRVADLRNGNTKSCGCYHRDMARSANLVHGHTSWKRGSSKTYHSWMAMHARCGNPKDKKYAYYGGRGISVCPRWNTFANFLEDMGERPEGLTLDRIDVDGNYEPGNCRWATWSEQQKNKRKFVEPCL